MLLRWGGSLSEAQSFEVVETKDLNAVLSSHWVLQMFQWPSVVFLNEWFPINVVLNYTHLLWVDYQNSIPVRSVCLWPQYLSVDFKKKCTTWYPVKDWNPIQDVVLPWSLMPKLPCIRLQWMNNFVCSKPLPDRIQVSGCHG